MKIHEIIWLDKFRNKFEQKHGVGYDEVEQIVFGPSHFRIAKRGMIGDEKIIVAYGQTISGRYIVVFFIYKQRNRALPISARNMTNAERRYYEKQAPRH